MDLAVSAVRIGRGVRRIRWIAGHVAVLALIWSLVGACGDRRGAEVEDQSSERAEAAREGPEAGGGEDVEPAPSPDATIVIAVRRTPRALDPLDELEPWGERVVDDLLFEGLVRRNPTAYPWVEPALADRCEVDRDFEIREVVCHVRSGAKFHDGAPVTAEDVLYSVQHWIDPRRGWQRLRHGLDGLRSAELVDGPGGSVASDRDPGQWIRIRFERPEPLALELLAAIKVVPRERHRGSRRESFGRGPVGTGPMRLQAMSADRIVLERSRPSEEGLARRIVLRAVPDGAEALTLLRRGDVQIVAEVSPFHVPAELAKQGMAPRFAAFWTSPARYDLLVFNLRQGPLADARVRAALQRAVPRAWIAREVYGEAGLSVAAPVDLTDPVPIELEGLSDRPSMDGPEDLGLPPLPAVEQDDAGLAEAAAILDGLGWKLSRGVRRKGTTNLRVTLMWEDRPGQGSDLARQIRTAWNDLGLQAPSSTASWSYLRGLLRQGSFEVALMRLGQPTYADLFPIFHSMGSFNVAGVSDATLDAALEAYRKAATRADRDAAKAKIAAEIERLGAIMVLHAQSAVMLASRRVTGLVFSDDLPRLDRLGLVMSPRGEARARPSPR